MPAWDVAGRVSHPTVVLHVVGARLDVSGLRKRDVSGRAVLSATERSGPKPAAWGRVTTSAPLSFDRRSTAAPGLTPDGEGGGDGEEGTSPDRNLSLSGASGDRSRVQRSVAPGLTPDGEDGRDGEEGTSPRP
jgi:hypothetical protein